MLEPTITKAHRRVVIHTEAIIVLRMNMNLTLRQDLFNQAF